VLLEEREVVGDADERSAIAREGHDRATAEDRVNGAALIAEFA
jgi:hypothetical protein